MRRGLIVAIALTLIVAVPSARADASAVLTPIAGGSAIPLNTFVTLSGPSITEGQGGDVGAGTIRFDVPPPFEIDITSTVTATVTSSGRCRGKDRPLLIGTGRGASSQIASVTRSAIEIKVVQPSAGDCRGTIAWSGTRVRATTYSYGAMQVWRAGTSTITGIPNGTSVGALSTVPAPTPAPTPTPPPPPTNDSFASATVISLPASIPGDITSATTETGEPYKCNGYPVGRTVWYRVSPSQDGVLVLKATADGRDKYIELFRGTSFSDLALLGCGFGEPGEGVREKVLAGGSYYVRVEYYSGAGPFTLSATLEPPLQNDDFGGASSLTLSARLTGNTQPALTEPGEPLANCVEGVPDMVSTVWFAVDAAKSGTLRIDTVGSAFDTVVAVYTGDSLGTLVRVACNDSAYGFALYARVGLHVEAARRYYVQLGGARWESGNYALAVDLFDTPANDDLVDAIDIGSDGFASGAFAGATLEPGEPRSQFVCGVWSSDQTVWYGFVAPHDGRATVAASTSGPAGYSSEPITLIFAGASYADLVAIGCATDGKFSFDVKGGAAYRIRLSEADTTYTIATYLDTAPPKPPAPANDNFVDAQIVAVPTDVTVDTTGATSEPGEPAPGAPCYMGSTTTWFAVTPNTTGKMSASTYDAATNFYTVLAVYEGSSLDTLTLLRCNHGYWGGFASFVSIEATAGKTYYIQLGGQYQMTGTAGFHISMP